MVLIWIAAGVEATCAELIPASANIISETKIFIGIYLRQILTPASPEVAGQQGPGDLLLTFL
jgi:hypothetical protein